MDVEEFQKALKPFHKGFKVVITSIFGYGSDRSNCLNEHIWCRQDRFSVNHLTYSSSNAMLDSESKFTITIHTGNGSSRH
jgi:hypothetical protein